MTSVSPTACLPHRASRTSNWELRNRESVLPFLRLKRREPNQGVSRRSNVSQHDDSGLAYRGSLLTVRVQTASAAGAGGTARLAEQQHVETVARQGVTPHVTSWLLVNLALY